MKRWRTKGGVVVLEIDRMKVRDRRGRPAVKIQAVRLTGGDHGWLWLKNLTAVRQ